MVNVNAGQTLELGDGDVLELGQYQLSFDTGNNRMEIRNSANNNITHVAKNQSGSLFPSDFADVLAGQALADDGTLHSTVQAAENAASGWVFVGPGSFTESVSLDTAGLSLIGSGRDTVVGTSDTSDAIGLGANDLHIESLHVDQQNGGNCIDTNDFAGQRATITNVSMHGSGSAGLRLYAYTDITVSNVRVTDAGPGIIYGTGGHRGVATNMHIDASGLADGTSDGVQVFEADDLLISDSVVTNLPDFGMVIDGNDCVVIGNRVDNAANDGIDIRNTDNIIANNRISGSGNADIDDQGTGTVLDANVTGAAN